MSVHMSARLAWHMDGWNGHVCKNPTGNSYCVGQHSYPGEMIAERRELPFENENKGTCCTKLKGYIPPCVYSINAFGAKTIQAFADPPDFFNDSTSRKTWDLAPATVCIWPYEQMYGEDVKVQGGGRKYDYDQRLSNAREYFDQFEGGKSLVFYYSNYSNPLNQLDERRYVLVGVSRIKKIGDVRFYEDCSERVQQRYGGGFIWQCDVTSNYPDEGLRLPYHLYLDQPDKLERFAFFPDNPRLFKYATREVMDDDALDLVERFLEIAGTLREMGDKSENWSQRIAWLQTLIGELWKSRGLYPGMPAFLSIIGFESAIPFWKREVQKGKEKETRDAIFGFLDGNSKKIDGLAIEEKQARSIAREWKLKDDDQRRIMRELLPRLDLSGDQVGRVIGSDRASNGLLASLDDIVENPYRLCEEYTGDGPDDMISFGKIDHGVFPSPDLGGDSLAEKNGWQRLRALCVERLRREGKHVFLPADKLIHDVNHRLSFLPEWKSHQFTEKYLSVDEEELSGALVFREAEGRMYVYWKEAYDNERVIENTLRELAVRPDITLRSAVTNAHWRGFLTHKDNVLARKSPAKYEQAIEKQADACEKIFRRPISVITGGAGTGKTKVIDAIVKAVEKGHGTGTIFQLLAPTGKAADRIREATKKPASTIHSFLAQHNWLNNNRTFKRSGGKRAEGIQTLIIDEASMLDLGLAAALFRAVKWSDVQRLIFVGDPNQLPPIGTGKVFADLIDWMKREQSDSIVQLETNVRQMENEIERSGGGILSLAGLYVRTDVDADQESDKAEAELLLQRVQEGGDIENDLRVIYWRDSDHLHEEMTKQMIADIESDSDMAFDRDRPFEAWRSACNGDDGQQRPEYLQVISPYRGEPFGTDNLNTVVQELLQPHARRTGGYTRKELDGVMLFDKVIQIRNRTKSDPAWAFNLDTRQCEAVEVFNGELGFVGPHAFDKEYWNTRTFKFERMQVTFTRKPKLRVGYGRALGKTPMGRWIPEQKVEENLELAYAISVHRAQGSEFERVYFIVPKKKAALLSPELFYTGMTRAKRHCTLFIEEDISPLLSMRRRERSHLLCIRASNSTRL